MRQGVILYVCGLDSTKAEFDIEQAVSNLDIKANQVEIVCSRTGHFSLGDAWFVMTTRGMHTISILFARITETSELELLRYRQRLI